MRAVDPAFTAARQSASSSLCKVWRIERRDGVVLRFTEHDTDLEIGGERYASTASFDASTIKASGDLTVDDLDVQGAFDSSTITERDLLAGNFSGARFIVGEILWDNLAAGIDPLRWGTLGHVKATGGAFLAELLGPTAPLQQPYGELVQPQCRATLGDVRCGVNLAAYTQTGTVTAVTSKRVVTASGITVPGGDPSYFQHGLLAWLTGPNAGLQMEVAECDGTTLTLMLEMFSLPEVGDTFDLPAGCDQSIVICNARFGNQRRFRGEPYKPVSDDVIKGPVR
ncbi:MAG: hypothetical protein BGO72_21405 [Burkholderiales bacterium 70-64]|nr:MAG: hypothetical protein BGO72_21405 [Burkholderiales bacterium 70-64]